MIKGAIHHISPLHTDLNREQQEACNLIFDAHEFGDSAYIRLWRDGLYVTLDGDFDLGDILCLAKALEAMRDTK